MEDKNSPLKAALSTVTDAALRTWQASAVRMVLLVIAVSGLLSWGSAINTDRSLTGLTPISWVYLAVYLGFVLLALLPRIGYRWRAWGLVTLAYINAVASFAKLGLVGSGRLYLLVVPIFSILLLGWRSGIVTTLLSLVVYYSTAYLITNYQMGDWHSLLENPVLFDRWGEAGTALVTFLVAVLAMLTSFQRLVRRTLDAHQETDHALERTAQTLQQRLNFEQLITNISTEFINLGPNEVDAGIQHALEAIGQFAGVDRSYIFQFTEGKRCITNSHEWCAGGIEPQSQRIQEQPIEVTPWTIEHIKRLETVQIPCVASLPDEAMRDQEEFQAQSIQSLICIPMVYQGGAIGLIGFDTVKQERDWSEDDVALLRVVGEMIVNALVHRHALAVEEEQRRLLEQRVGERTRELATVNAIAAVVSGTLDLQDILGAALDKTLEVTGMELGLAYRLEATAEAKHPADTQLSGNTVPPGTLLPADPGSPDPSGLRPFAYRGLSGQFFSATTALNVYAGKIKQAWESGFPEVWDPQAYPDPITHQAIEEEGIRLLIAIPLLVKDRLVGALIIGSHQSRPVMPEELAMLSAIGQQVALAVENARLYEQVQQTTQLEERGRLARELHDSVTQSLYSVTLYAEAAARLFSTGDTQTAVEHLRELRDTSREALREMRLLIYELRPPVLGTGGLAGALQARLDAVEARAGLSTELQVDGTERVPAAVQEELYHIAREALNNLLKHARAHSVRVLLLFQETSTLLEICDDGVGFHQAEIGFGGGLGIAGMKERAQRIGAHLEIHSTPGEGTVVRVVVKNNGRS